MVDADRNTDLPVTDPQTVRIETLEKLVSTLRHDLRNAISSTSLVADALLIHADPIVQRSGKRVATAVERIVSILDGTLDIVPSRGHRPAPKP